jgi:hypothetical protein
MAQAISRWLPTAAVRGSKPDLGMWDLWWDKVTLGRFSPSSSVSPAIVVRSINYSTITLLYHPGKMYNRPNMWLQYWGLYEPRGPAKGPNGGYVLPHQIKKMTLINLWKRRCAAPAHFTYQTLHLLITCYVANLLLKFVMRMIMTSKRSTKILTPSTRSSPDVRTGFTCIDFLRPVCVHIS